MVGQLELHRARINTLAFATACDRDPDRDDEEYLPLDTLLVGSADGRLSIWNLDH